METPPLCKVTIGGKNYALHAKLMFANIREISNKQAQEILSKHFGKKFSSLKASSIMENAGFQRQYRLENNGTYVWWTQ